MPYDPDDEGFRAELKNRRCFHAPSTPQRHRKPPLQHPGQERAGSLEAYESVLRWKHRAKKAKEVQVQILSGKPAASELTPSGQLCYVPRP